MIKQKRYQEGYWISVGMGFGMMLGLLFGIPFNNSSLLLLLGIAIGLIFGYVLEKRFNPAPIKLTPRQRRLKIVMGVIAFVLALLIAIFLVTR